MEMYALLGLVIVIIILIRIIASHSSSKRKVFKNNVYSYSAKPLLMTRTEADFFIKINNAVEQHYYVFPQVHLSALLDHKIKGQDWHYAFRHINGKSVDFVLCDKETLRPTYAIELDDTTHEMRDRRERDIEVERVFKEAKLPLVRFANKNSSEQEIIQALSEARSLLNS